MPPSVIDSTELPTLSQRTRCVLMPRDPNVIYAYWDYSPKDMERLHQQFKSKTKDLKFVLRVHSTVSPARDIEVGPTTKDAYINVGQDNAGYCVEVGVAGGKNHFTALTRSNTVQTPAKTASKRNDLIWQDIKLSRESQPYIQEDIKEDPGRGLMQGQAGEFQQVLTQGPSGKGRRVKGVKYPRIYHLTAHDIRAYYLKLFHSKSKGRRGVPRTSLAGLVKGIPAGIPWQKVLPLVTCIELIRRTHPGASERTLTEKQGASEKFLGLQGSEGRLNKRKFFFEIATELIVHGRTEPDAAVWLNQQGIKLNPDGTFSLRYALPDGEVPLKFVAQSSDGVEQRHINTRVEREKTVYFPKILKNIL
ncbi:MAG: DUF4912 domain-containing protein [Candidatus Omnitrophica bacterium]|nr:DUF4912 domain-containing protein [Candidatus Omnitrophota bacterium]MDE2008618.1 DUF4912 domain-containing protein [Candidatus Omnitrophota bacterium]MDE2214084.1 DUF4912 domain-containing protein [Candidatus Omnitrophota bacterium]MDE2230938.1 DUF4912 domain-containing protein [Candidatus Omnitrophota bacterium]